MEAFKKNIENIRKMMEELKTEKYALVNPALVELDEHIKDLYLRVLCTVIQYENDPSDMQLLFLRRIHQGISVEEPLEEYMRRALEISEQDIQEFLEVFAEGTVKYYFTVDALLLLSMGDTKIQKPEGFSYLAELVELLEIPKDDLEYLCTVVKSILQQDSAVFDTAKDMKTERVENLNFVPYIENYYAGLVIDTEKELYYFAPDRSLSEEMTYPTSFANKNVTFENVILHIEEDWSFQQCEKVVFRNCELIGESSNFHINRVGKVILDSCRVHDFSNRVLYIEQIDDLVIENCEFINCGYNANDYFASGSGIVFCNSNHESSSFILNGNYLQDCYALYDNTHTAYGVFIGGGTTNTLVVTENTFKYCKGDSIILCYYNTVTEDNNQFVGIKIRLFR